MSRIGEQEIEVPGGVAVEVAGDEVRVKGPNGELATAVPVGIAVSVAEGKVSVTRDADTRMTRSLHGLTRSLIANAIEGVSKGFSKQLEIEGVGFRAAIQGQKLEVSLGFASPVAYDVPDGITVSVEGGTSIKVAGADKQQVGDVAARIRSFYKAEPYKGKGLRYKGEQIRRKVGKTVA